MTHLLRSQENTRLNLPEPALHTRAEVVALRRRLEVPDAEVEGGTELGEHVRDDVHLVETLHLE